MLRPLGFTLLKLCRSANIICEQIRISRAGCCGRFSDRSTKVLRSISPPTDTTSQIYRPRRNARSPRISGKHAVNQASRRDFLSFFLLSFLFSYLPSFLSSIDSEPSSRSRSKTVGGSFLFPLKRGGEKNIGFIFKAKNFIYVYLLETWRISEENVV